MNKHQRHSYLKAMGIPVWVQRTQILNAEYIDDVQTEQITTPASVSPTPIPLQTDSSEPVPQHISAYTPQITQQPATDCSNLDTHALQALVNNCQLCTLHTSRKQPIYATGNLSANYMVISDVPSSDEDRQGHALAGKAGVLLSNMLAAINLSTNNTCLTHTVKCRTPNDRIPKTEEQTNCQTYLDRQIELIKPKAILVLGRIAAQHVLQKKASLSILRGHTHAYRDSNIPAIVTYHPRNLLRQPSDKRKAWEDLKRFLSLNNE